MIINFYKNTIINMNNQNEQGFSLYGILFFSNKCKFCYDLRTIIHNNGLNYYIQEMLVDEMREEQIASWGLECVPTLVVVYENKSQNIRNKTVYKEKEVFEWVEQRILQKKQVMANSSENTRQSIITDNISAKKKDNIHDYHPLETNSSSDIYSYWFKDMSKDTGIAQPKNFLPYGQDDEYRIATYNDKHQHKLKTNDSKQLLVEIENNRKKQNDEISNNNETRQLLLAKRKLGML